jgi:aryl-alcohol dehydrogenase-like predicted oxidoreductase
MHYRILGKSGLKISEIGLGCMSIPAADEVMGIKIIHHAMELGINYFDTADLYDKGVNETIVGKALKGKRDKVVLATKVGNQWKSDGSGFVWNPRKEYILEAVEGSLRRLQTDHIDLYQLHGGTIEDPIDETIEAFELLKTQGKIRHYGISSIRPNVIREYVKRSNITSVMMQYSLADRRPEEEMLDFLHANNIGVLARGSLAQGMLVNKPAKEYLGHSVADLARGQAAVQSLERENRTAAQAAIRYVLHHPAISAAIVGVSTIEQLVEVASTSNSESLTTTEYKILCEALPSKFYEQHR